MNAPRVATGRRAGRTPDVGRTASGRINFRPSCGSPLPARGGGVSVRWRGYGFPRGRRLTSSEPKNPSALDGFETGTNVAGGTERNADAR